MSKGLEALEEIVNKFAEQMIRANKCYFNAISKTNAIEYLYRTPQVRTLEKELKALEIIKEKGVDVGYLKTCETLEEYNSNCWNDEEDFNKKLTQEEFDTLKRWLYE